MAESVEANNAQTMTPQEKLDELFFAAIEKLSLDAINKAAECTEEVFHLSSNYLSQEAFNTLRKFQSLYEDSVEMNQKKNQLNDNVDAMFDQIQQGFEAGKSQHEIEATVVEDKEEQELRVGLSGLQKQLEGLITVEDGLKDKLMPAITSMQFEDEVRKRLSNIQSAWRIFSQGINSNQFDPDAVSALIEKSLTSYRETVLFYETVIKKEPPEGHEESIFVEFE